MTTSTQRSDKAWRAVTRFRALVPTLGAFARALTSNPKTSVKIVKAGSYSDGDTIYLAPPISLGEEVFHDRMICGMRDENLQLLCEGCAQQEDVTYRLFHEMGHIVYGSSDKFVWHTVGNQLMEYTKAIWQPDFPWFSDGLDKQVLAAKKNFNPCETVLQLAHAIHPYLKLFTNAIEDVRVDSATYVARPGIKTMAEAAVWAIMSEGVQTWDEEGNLVTDKWSERSLDMQVMIGFLHRCFEYNMAHFISEEANAALDDPELIEYVAQARDVTDQYKSYKLACKVLYRLHQMGLCEPPPEPEDKEQEPQEPEDSGESEEKPDESSDDTKDENEDDSSDGENSSEESRASEQGSGDQNGTTGDAGTPGDPDNKGVPNQPATPKELEKLGEILDCEAAFPTENSQPREDLKAIEIAVMQALWFEGPSVRIGGVHVHTYRDRFSKDEEFLMDDGWTGGAKVSRLIPSESVISRATMHARIVFSDNKRTKVVRNKKAGRIAAGKLHRAALEDERLFARKERPGKRDYFGVIMLDISGSNSSGTINLVREMAMAQGELLHRLGVPFEMYAHTGLPTPDYYRTRDHNMFLNIYPVVDKGERWTSESRSRVAALEACCANLDGHALEFARKRLDAMRATDHFILYSSDGAMPAENFAEELEILKRELKVCKQKGYTVQGVGLRTDAPTQHGLDTVIVNSSADIGLVVKQLEKRLTK